MLRLGLSPRYSKRNSNGRDIGPHMQSVSLPCFGRSLVKTIWLQNGCSRGFRAELKYPKNQVRARGLEPPRDLSHRDLNPARLPIPPRPRVWWIVALLEEDDQPDEDHHHDDGEDQPVGPRWSLRAVPVGRQGDPVESHRWRIPSSHPCREVGVLWLGKRFVTGGPPGT